MSAARRDLAARTLDAAVRLLPAERRPWGEAMRAELAVIPSARDRLRFALGCTRVAAVASAARAPGQLVLVAGAASAVLWAESAARGALGQMLPLGLLLGLLWGLGRLAGPFGPVRGDRASRIVRAGGCGLVGVCFLTNGASQPFASSNWGAVFALLLALNAGVFLAITARASSIGTVALANGAVAGLATGAVLFAVMHFERDGKPLASHLPGGGWLELAVIGIPALAVAHTARRTRRSDQAVMTGLCAGALAGLVVALAGFAAILLLPGRVPDIAGHAMPAGTSAAARQAENALEAGDPYAGVLLAGTLIALVLWLLVTTARVPADATPVGDRSG